MASSADTQRASRYHNQSGVEIRTVDFGGVGGIAALDPALPQVLIPLCFYVYRSTTLCLHSAHNLALLLCFSTSRSLADDVLCKRFLHIGR